MDKTKQYKVLFLEDDSFIAEIFVKKCKEMKVNCVILADPTEDIIKKVLTIKPDLIATNIILPAIDGFEIVKRLKANKKTRDIPVMFVTNMGLEENIQEGLSLGAVDYIVTADYTPEEIIEKWLKYLSGSQKHS